MSARVLAVEVIGKMEIPGRIFGSWWPDYVLHVQLLDVRWATSCYTTRRQYERVSTGDRISVVGTPNERGSYTLQPYSGMP